MCCFEGGRKLALWMGGWLGGWLMGGRRRRDLCCCWCEEIFGRPSRKSRITHQRQTKVKLKRNSSHLSVRDMAWFILPLLPDPPRVVGVCSEMLTERESSILTKLARPRTYLIRMAMMQTPPTSQPRNTGG